MADQRSACSPTIGAPTSALCPTNVESRWADNHYDRLPCSLPTRSASGGADCRNSARRTPAALAAKAATTTIPIVFAVGIDPVKTGIVVSLDRPGGNITGATFFANELTAKRLGLLHELLPEARVIATLLNPKFSDAPEQLRLVRKQHGHSV